MLQICYLKPEQLDLICVVVAAAAVVVVVDVVVAAAAVAAAVDVLLTVSVCWQTPLMLLPAHMLHAECGGL